MIIHIVMFKFKDDNKEINVAKIKDKLEALEEKIDVLRFMEVGINFNESDRAFDLSLYSTFESEEDLKKYALHEEHLSVVNIIKDVTSESKVVDYVTK